MTVRAGKRTEYCPYNRIVKLVKLALKGQLPIRLLRLFADHVQVSGTVPYCSLCTATIGYYQESTENTNTNKYTPARCISIEIVPDVTSTVVKYIE